MFSFFNFVNSRSMSNLVFYLQIVGLCLNNIVYSLAYLIVLSMGNKHIKLVIYISSNICSIEKRLFDFSSNAGLCIFLMGSDQKALIVSLMLVFDICNKYAIDEPLIRALQKIIEKLICRVRVFEIKCRCYPDNYKMGNVPVEPCDDNSWRGQAK